jgi:hypothetical protein
MAGPSAESTYDAIRANPADVGRIAANTGYHARNIRKVKNHLFFAEHLLDRYVAHGVAAYRARFDPDPAIAAAWLRLERGTFNRADLQLLRHEIAEAWYMRRHRSGYDAAHQAAQRRFPMS